MLKREEEIKAITEANAEKETEPEIKPKQETNEITSYSPPPVVYDIPVPTPIQVQPLPESNLTFASPVTTTTTTTTASVSPFEISPTPSLSSSLNQTQWSSNCSTRSTTRMVTLSAASLKRQHKENDLEYWSGQKF